MTLHPCGCLTRTDPASGVIRSVSKCDDHARMACDNAALTAAYYAEFGLIDAATEKPLPTDHAAQLAEALGGFPLAPLGGRALELGPGVSPYVPAILAAGWSYHGRDLSPWACDWLRRTYGVEADVALADGAIGAGYGLILAAHCLEHLDDAPGALRRWAACLAPGGELWLITPDDTDQCNPDHLWYFSLRTLRRCVERAGLIVVGVATRRYIERENFLYLRAVQPA